MLVFCMSHVWQLLNKRIYDDDDDDDDDVIIVIIVLLRHIQGCWHAAVGLYRLTESAVEVSNQMFFPVSLMTPCLHIRRPATADPKMAYTQSDPPGATPHRERSLTSTSVLLFCGGELTGNRASCNNAFHRLSGWSSARRLYYRSPLTDRQTVKRERERERERQTEMLGIAGRV